MNRVFFILMSVFLMHGSYASERACESSVYIQIDNKWQYAGGASADIRSWEECFEWILANEKNRLDHYSSHKTIVRHPELQENELVIQLRKKKEPTDQTITQKNQ